MELNNKAYYIVTHAKDNGQGSDVLSGIHRNMQFMRLPDEPSYDELRDMVDKMLSADNSEDKVSEQKRNDREDEMSERNGHDSEDEISEQNENDSEDEISKQNRNDSQKELPPELEERVEKLYEKGNRLERAERYEEALQVWQEGYALIPVSSRLGLEATIQFLAAIGDIYFLRKRMYQEAYECFDAARGYGGYGNPFIMLRLGECCLGIGDEKKAIEYLMRAWMMEGEEIFEPDENGEDDGSKYYEFLRTHVDLGKR